MTEHAPNPVDIFPEYTEYKIVTTRALETMAGNNTPQNVRDLYTSAISLGNQYNDKVFANRTKYNQPHPWYVTTRYGYIESVDQTPFTVAVNPTTAEVRVQPSYRSQVPGIIEGKYGICISPGTENTPGSVGVTERFRLETTSDISPDEIEKITVAITAINQAEERNSERVSSDIQYIHELHAALQPLFPKKEVHL